MGVKSSLAGRQQDTIALNKSPDLVNETANNIQLSMLLRRHSLHSGQTFVKKCDDPSALVGIENLSTTTVLATANAINSDGSMQLDHANSQNQLDLESSFENKRSMTLMMKTSCPKYFQIPHSSRKRILRFLCDNGWIQMSHKS